MTKTWILALAGLGVAACGGGGGGSSTPPPSTPDTPPPSPDGIAISGSALSQPIVETDSDINDPRTRPVRNNTEGTAQQVSNPTLVKGFVANRGVGGSGNFASSADEFDYFRATLQRDDVVFVSFADFDPDDVAAVDIDLRLIQDGETIAVSGSLENDFEQIIVRDDGEYVIEVHGFSGASPYTLTIDRQLARATYTQTDMDRVAANTAMVQAAPSRTDTAAAVAIHSDGLARFDADQVARRVDDRLSLRAAGAGRSPTAAQRTKLDTISAIKAMNVAEGADVFAPYSYPVRNFSDPTPDASRQWNLYQIGWDAVEALNPAAVAEKRPLIAVLDSGFIPDHPDIAPQVVDQFDFVPSSIDGDGFDRDASADADPNDDDEACQTFHGSHVASVAAAPKNNQGIVGVNPRAQLMLLKLGHERSPECGLIQGDIAGAVRYAAGLPNSSGSLPSRPADVIIMSFGTLQPSRAVSDAVAAAQAAGTMVVASGGNNGGGAASSLPSYPASYDGVFGVSATARDGSIAGYSSQYPELALAAPGGDVVRTAVGEGIVGAVDILEAGGFTSGYEYYQGTSFSAPHLAGGLSLMRSIDPELTVNEARVLIDEGRLTDDEGEPGRDVAFGAGLMSLEKMYDVAVNGVSGPPPLPPTILVSPTTLFFDAGRSSRIVRLVGKGGGGVSVTGIDLPSTAPWLTAGPSLTGPNGTGDYLVTVDRTRLPEGQTETQLTFRLSDGINRQVRIVVNKAAAVLGQTTPPITVRLQRYSGSEVVETTDVAGNGSNAFSFAGLPSGEYRLIASTDVDADGEFCDQGELCGRLPEPGNGTTFEVDANRTDLAIELFDVDEATPVLSGAR